MESCIFPISPHFLLRFDNITLVPIHIIEAHHGIYSMFLKLITDTGVKILYTGIVYTQLGVWDVWMIISSVLQYFITMLVFLWPAFASTKLGISLKHYCKECLLPLQQLSFSSFYFTLHSLCSSFTINIIPTFCLAEILQCFCSNDCSPICRFSL